MRAIFRTINDSLSISETLFKFKHIIPKVNEVVQIASQYQLKFVIIQVFNEVVSVQTFKGTARGLVKIVSEGISIIHGFFLKLQYGLVTQGQNMATFWTSESEEVSDSTQSVGTGISSESEETTDSSQSISTGDTEENIEGGN